MSTVRVISLTTKIILRILEKGGGHKDVRRLSKTLQQIYHQGFFSNEDCMQLFEVDTLFHVKEFKDSLETTKCDIPRFEKYLSFVLVENKVDFIEVLRDGRELSDTAVLKDYFKGEGKVL